MYLNDIRSCLQLVFTYGYSKYLFLVYRSSEYLSFCVFMLKEKSTLEKKINF